MIHPQLVPHATMLVYILTDAAVEPAVLDGYLRRPSRSASTASRWMATPPPTTPCCCWPPAPAGRRRPGKRRLCLRAHPGLHLAGPPDCGRRRRHYPCCGVAHRGSGHGRGRAQNRQGHRPFAAGQNRLGRLRPQLGPARGGHRLLRRADRPRAHRHPLRRTGYLPRRRPRRRSSTRPPPTPISAQPEFSITIQLHQGAGSCVFWTTDLTHEYVRINADYST